MTDFDAYRPQIEAALAHGGGTHLFEDVVQGVRDRRFQMWVNGGTVAITEIIVYPRKKIFHVFIAGGNRKELFEMIEPAWEWAASVGCESMTMAGRKGWLKLMGKFGFKPTLNVMER